MRRLRLIVALGALLGMFAGVLTTSPAYATFPGTNGQITFAALPTPGAPGKQIFTIEPNGTGLRQITHLDGNATTPHWSRTGPGSCSSLTTPLVSRRARWKS